ncbi:MAG: HAD family hydrolase [Turneriella sp.]
MTYKYFALDIDGTIFSSEDIIYPTYREAIERYSAERSVILETPARERIMLEIGKPVKKIFENLFPQLTDQDRDYLSDSVLKILCECIAKGEGEYYPQVRETVEAIVARGGKILVASNGRRAYIDAILQYCGILGHVMHPTYIDGVKIRTKNEIMQAYQALGLPVNQILMVGDRLSDFDAARAIGCDFAWCAYGHAPAGEITEFEVRLEKFTDLKNYA